MAKSRARKTDRTDNRAARQARRHEIIDRWARRKANRYFVHYLNKSDQTAQNVIYLAMHFGVEAPYEDLIEAVEPTALKPALARALRIIELKEMAYADYLGTDEWRRIAEKVKQRYDGRCALDADHLAEHVHHRTYKRRGREFLTDLIPLCRDCHSKFHGKQP